MDSNSVIINFGFSDVVFFNYCFGQNDPVSTKLRRFLLENILDDVPQDLTCLQAPLTNERVLNLDDPLEIKLENVYLLMLNDFSGSAQANQITQLSEQILHQNKHVKNHIIAFSRSPRDKLMKKFQMSQADMARFHGDILDIRIFFLGYTSRWFKMKKKLTTFEALLYLMGESSLKGMSYEDDEGIIEMMKERFRRFEKIERFLCGDGNRTNVRDLVVNVYTEIKF